MTRLAHLLVPAFMAVLLTGCASPVAAVKTSDAPSSRTVTCGQVLKMSTSDQHAIELKLGKKLAAGQWNDVLAYCDGRDGETLTDMITVIVSRAKGTQTSAPEAAPDAALPQQSYSDSSDQGNGFKQTLTITMGPVILGTNTALLTSQWASVGGTGKNPCIDANPSGTGFSGPVLESKLAGFAFGTLTIVNDSPDFPAKPYAYSFSLDANSGDAIGFGYSDGAKCVSIYGSDSRVNPAWGTSAKWGPVPVVVAIRDLLSPAFPKGDPSKLALPLKFAVQAFPAPPLAIPLSLYTP